MRRFLMFTAAALVGTCAVVHAAQNQQLFDIPQSEVEQVVVQWLQRKGYEIYRYPIDNLGVRFYARKGNQSWLIALRPHSPLSTKVEAKCTIDHTVTTSRLEHLWTVIGDHTMAAKGQIDNDQRSIPAAVLSKIESVVCIQVDDAEKSMQISGFIIDPEGLILCTAHGLRNTEQSVTVTLHNGRELTGRVIRLDKQKDLSLVDVSTALGVPISLSSGRDLQGDSERLYSIVCPAYSRDTIFSGMLRDPPRTSNNQLLWQVNMQVRHGSSGSPVFDDRGNLVAVVKGRYRGADTVGFLIPFATLADFLGDHPK